MSYWEAIAVLAQVAGTVYSANTAANNANRAQAIGGVNAYNTIRTGREQATMALLAARFNSGVLTSQVKAKTDASRATAKYNADLLIQTANYNSLLYEEEIDSVFEAAELDSQVLEVATHKAVGALEARQSVSGVVMGQDSNADAVMSIMAESALEDLVIKTNAKTKAKGLLNSAAQGEWQANMEGRRLQYEAQVNGDAERFSTSMQAMSTLFDGKMQAWAATSGASNRAFETLFSSAQTYDNYEDQSTAIAISGIANAATTYSQMETKQVKAQKGSGAADTSSTPSLLEDTRP